MTAPIRFPQPQGQPSTWQSLLRLIRENPNSLKLLIGFSLLFLVLTYFSFTRFQSQRWNEYEEQGLLTAQLLSRQVEQGWGQLSANGAASLPGSSLKAVVGSICQQTLQPTHPDLLGLEIHTRNGNLFYQCEQSGAAAANRMAPVDASSRLEFPANSSEAGTGALHLKLSAQPVESSLQAAKQWFAIVFLVSWLVAFLAVLFNTYVWSKHLKALSQGVQRLSSGEFGYQIDEKPLWGELKTLALAFNDMSARLQAYEAQNIETLTLERNKLEAILLSIADGVVVCEDNGLMVLLNEAAARMLGGKSPALLEGRNVKDYTTTEGEACFAPVLEAFREHRRTMARAGIAEESNLLEPFSRQIELPELTLKVILSPIKDALDNRLGFVMIMHDVTKETEVDKLKTNFISNVSHELRTPVTTIKSYVDTLFHHGDELDKQTQYEFTETIYQETERLKKLVNDILDFSRLEEGGVHMEKQWQDLGPVVNLTVQSVRVLAQQKQLVLSTSVESNLPKVYINSESIERVLRNLLSNAIKYTSEGGRIKVKVELSEDGKQVEVSVQDNGVGIAEEHLPYIFDRFYRVENKVHTVKGTGLGLHLVKVAIEEYHSGYVFVSSRLGQGSTFGFRLPISMVENDPLSL